MRNVLENQQKYIKKMRQSVQPFLLQLIRWLAQLKKRWGVNKCAYLPSVKRFFKEQTKLTLTSLMGLMLLWGNVHVPLPFFPSSTNSLHSVSPLQIPANNKNTNNEIFGFAPYWNLDKLQHVDFNVLTTLSYFGIPVNTDGSLNTQDPGYTSFGSQAATDLFTKAHQHGTRVVATLTLMDNASIEELLQSGSAQQNLINQTITLIKSRGIDGVNVDFEYTGDPGQDYRNTFSQFIAALSSQMHAAIPNSKVSVSVYALAVKDPQLDDIATLSKSADDVFMMAYDFATSSSAVAMPTSPLYGYKAGKYYYDVSTAVDDFLSVMPAGKLILGVPWYGYNYAVTNPSNDAPTNAYDNSSFTQTYASIKNQDPTQASGWDPYGEVGWKAYVDPTSSTWRMVYVEDQKSLSLKYDFVKSKNLAGVGIWALGNEDQTSDLWSSLESSFGIKYADADITGKPISE